MKEYYTAFEVLVTGGEFNYDTFEVDRFDDEFVNKAFEAFKDFVSDTARGNRRVRIWEAGIYNVKHWGFSRGCGTILRLEKSSIAVVRNGTAKWQH